MPEDEYSNPPDLAFPQALTVSALLALILGAAPVGAQLATPEVAWRVDSVAALGLRGDSLQVQITAALTPGWHLYSITQPEGGPIATAFTAANPLEWAVAGKIRAPQSRVVTSILGAPQYLYEGTVQFRVPLRRLTARAAAPTLAVRFQVCSERVCLPPRTIELAVPPVSRGSHRP